MSDIPLVSYRVKMSPEQLVRTNILFYTLINDIPLTKSELNTLILLSTKGTPTLASFCNELVSTKVYLNQYSARNGVSDLHEKQLVEKIGDRKKVVRIDERLRVINGPSVLSIMCAADGK